MKVHIKFIKAFGVLLVAALLFAALPAGEVKAQATEVSTAQELTDALSADEAEIIVMADIDVGSVSGSAFTVSAGKTITLDLNGHTISADTNTGAIISNAGTLTVLDNSFSKGGHIINTTDTQQFEYEQRAKSAISNTGMLTVNSGVIVTGPASGHGSYPGENFNPAYGIDNLSGGKVTVNGATISGAYGMRNFANVTNTTITINGGIITGKDGIAMQSFGTHRGILTINGEPTITATAGSAIYAAGVTQYNEIEINGGTFSGEDVYGTLCVVDGTLKINGGTFTGRNGTDSLINYYAIVDITAGTFNGNIWGGDSDHGGLTTFAPAEGKCITVNGDIYDNVEGKDLVNACPVHNVSQSTYHATIQGAIDAASDGDTIYAAAGTYSETGGIRVNKEGINLKLADGVIVDNNAQCFHIEADHVRIIADTHAGAKCIPANESGIWVHTDVNDFVVEKLEFDGGGHAGEGIHLRGGHEGIQIIDNYFHGFHENAPVITVFTGEVTGDFDIQGNMFKDGAGISNYYEGLNAKYNSWGVYEVTLERTNFWCAHQGLELCETEEDYVDFDPWTHAEILLKSTNPTEDGLANHVFADETITYEVYGVFREIFGADFTLTYAPDVLEVVTITPETDAFTPDIINDDLVTHTDGKIRFAGYGEDYTPFTSDDADGTLLYTVTFKPKVAAKTTTAIGIDPETDVFAMSPPWEYQYFSNNVFGILPDDVVVTVIDHPVISSDDIEDYYLVGEDQQFEVSLANPETGEAYEHVMFKITVPDAVAADIVSIQYEEGPGSGVWLDLPYEYVDGVGLVGWYGGVTYGGFPLTLPKDAEAGSLRVEFANAGDYTIDLELFTVTGDVASGLDYTDETIRLIAEKTYTMNVYDKPTIESDDVQGYYLTDEMRGFTVTTINPVTGGDFYPTMFKITIPNAVLADVINSIEYDETWATPTGWNDLILVQDGANVVGWYGLVTVGGFPLKPNTNNDGLFQVDFKLAGEYTIQLELYEMDGVIVADPYDYSGHTVRLLATKEFEMIVYDKPVISSDDITGPYQAEQPQDFHLEITMDPDMCAIMDITFDLHFDFPAGTVVEYNGTEYTCTAAGCTIPVDPCADLLPFTVIFPGAFDGNVTVSLYDMQWPDRLLADETFDVTVYGNFAMDGKVSMQGRTMRAGVPITLTGTLGFGPYTAISTDVIGTNLFFADLAGDIYEITTLQPRYLNVTTDLHKQIAISGNGTIPYLYLYGGNAVWEGHATSNNQIDIFDASEVGTKYGTGTINDNADVNFDGKVNIQDLALVGGNFDLTAEEAYQDWLADLGSVINITTGVSYDTIKDAIEDAVSGETLVLINDLTIEPEDYMNTDYYDYALMVSGKSITIDLFGHTLTSDADATVYISASGALTLRDSLGGGVIQNIEGYEAVGVYGTFVMESGALVSNDGYALYNYNSSGLYGTSTILSGSLTGYDRGIANCGVLTIHDAEITILGDDPDHHWVLDNSGYLAITGKAKIKSLILKNGDHAPEVPGKGTLVLPAGADFEVIEEVYALDGATIIIHAGASVAGITGVTAPTVGTNEYTFNGTSWIPN